MADFLLDFVLVAGIRVLGHCEEARQCNHEVSRIAVRTQNVLGTLKDASQHFSQQVGMEASLLELKKLFETIRSLLRRCANPETSLTFANALSYARRAATAAMNAENPNRIGLINAERRLEQITHDLGLPMLSDIKSQLNQMHALQAEAVASASKDAEALAEVVRNEIRKAMMATGTSGVTIREAIDEEIAHLEHDDYDDDRRERKVQSAGGKKPGPNRRKVVGSVDSKSKTPKTGGGSVDSKLKKSNTVGGSVDSKLKKPKKLVMKLGRVRFEDLQEGKALGEGTFGVVVKGTYRGRDVAIKKARGALGSASIMDAFRQEAEIHFAMRHENIVEVVAFGLGDAEHPPCMVMELMNESLYDLLGAEEIEMTLPAKASIVRDVCEGLRFLHLRGIVHRDLKSLNVLLDHAWTAKISDFGLAKVNSTIATSTGGSGYHSKVGSDFWMAPEVYGNRGATQASDVFSLHVVMWEVFAQQRAGQGKPIGERLLSDPAARLPPLTDMGCSEAVESNVRNIVDRSGCAEPRDRPAMDEICSIVSRVLLNIQNPSDNPLRVVAPAPAPQRQQDPAVTTSSSSFGTLDTAPSTGTESRTFSSMSMGRSRGREPPPLPNRGPRPRPAPTKPDDRGALVALLFKCSPPAPASNPAAKTGWKISTGWGEPVSMSRWYGVDTRFENETKSGSERVTRLTLPENGLCGEIPEELMWLDCLISLELNDNNLTGALRSSLGSLTNLHTLDLSRNNLVGTIPPDVGNLVSLKVLELHHTNLHGEIPETIGNLVNLERLDLSNTAIGGIVPKAFAKLKALRVLRLHNNILNGVIPDSFLDLDRLEELNLGGNKFGGAIVIGNWPVLRILDLSANELEGWVPPELMELESLTTLRLYRNFHVSGGIPMWLSSMKCLEEIDLSATNLGGEIPPELGDLPRLSSLTLGSCKLAGPIPPELGRLRYLRHLALFDNKLTGAIPTEQLAQLRSLRNLNLEKNELSVTKAPRFAAGMMKTVGVNIGKAPRFAAGMKTVGVNIGKKGTKAELAESLPNGCIIRL